MTSLVPDSNTPLYVGPPPDSVPVAAGIPSQTGLLPRFDNEANPPEAHAISAPRYAIGESVFAGMASTAWGIMLLDHDLPTFAANPSDNIMERIGNMQGEGGYMFDEADVDFLATSGSYAELEMKHWQLQEKAKRLQAAAQHKLAFLGGAVADYDLVLGGGITKGATMIGMGAKLSRVTAASGVALATYGSYKSVEGKTPFSNEDMLLHTMLSSAGGAMSRIPKMGQPKVYPVTRTPVTRAALGTDDEMITATRQPVAAAPAAAPPVVPIVPVVGKAGTPVVPVVGAAVPPPAAVPAAALPPVTPKPVIAAAAPVAKPAAPVVAPVEFPRQLMRSVPAYRGKVPLTFATKFDQAAYLLSLKGPKDFEIEIVAWATQVSGKTIDEIRAHGKSIAQLVKLTANKATGDTLHIPDGNFIKAVGTVGTAPKKAPRVIPSSVTPVPAVVAAADPQIGKTALNVDRAVRQGITEAVHAQSVPKLIETLRANSPSAAYSIVLERVAKKIRKLEVVDGAAISMRQHTDANSTGMAAWSKDYKNYAVSFAAKGENLQTGLHELIHVATLKTLTESPSLSKDIKALHAAITKAASELRANPLLGEKFTPEVQQFMKDTVNGRNNALANPYEIVTWGLVDGAFQAWLNTIPYKGGTMWTHFVSTLKQALGLGDEVSDTAMSELLRLSDKALR